MTVPAAPSTIDADIAAFIAEGHEPDDIAGEPALESPEDGDSVELEPGEAEPDTEEPSADGDLSDPADGVEGDAEAKPSAVQPELAALKAALEKDDPIAFVKALGSKAEKLLGSKAHIALRLAVKEAEKHQTTAKAEQAKAQELATKLGEKYGDPISARKAAETGDPNAFLDMVEKWSGGNSWNDIQKWLASCLAGRPARLEAKQRQEASGAVDAQAKQEQKQAEVKAWVDGGVKKLAPELHDPEIVDMVVAEIRAGYTKGITTPAKALPLVRKKLEARYQKLHKVFGKGAKASASRPPSPSAAAARTDGGSKTRRTTLEEDIAWAKAQARGVK